MYSTCIKKSIFNLDILYQHRTCTNTWVPPCWTVARAAVCLQSPPGTVWRCASWREGYQSVAGANGFHLGPLPKLGRHTDPRKPKIKIIKLWKTWNISRNINNGNKRKALKIKIFSVLVLVLFLLSLTFGPRSPGWSVKIKANSFRADLRNFLLSLCIAGL